MNKKRIGRALLLLALCAAMALPLAGCGENETDGVPVQSVSSITGHGSVGYLSRFAGMVVAGRTENVELEDGFTVEELFVQVGQAVNEGDVLFSYNNEALELSLQQAELEIENLKNSIETNNQAIERLEKLIDTVSSASEKLSYTLEIQSLQMQNKESEYNISVKQAQLERQKAALTDTEVRCPVSGTVTSINSSGQTDNYGNPLPYIVISETANLRIKGTVSELNISGLPEGSPVTILSRVDADARWTGFVQKIDYESADQNKGGGYYYYDSGDGMSSPSKYTFYVTLDSSDGLMMGQHVYVQSGLEAEQDDTLRLPSYYVMDAESSPWVWAADSRGKLEKRSLTLGEYDEMTDCWTVTAGLSFDDYITMNDDSYKSGMKTYQVQDMLPASSAVYDGGEGYATDDYMEVYPEGGAVMTYGAAEPSPAPMPEG